MDSEKDLYGNILIVSLFILLFIAGIISYKSIDWQVLKKLESQPLNLPPSATRSATLNQSQ